MTEPRQSALTDPADEPLFLDVAQHGDAFDDPGYRALLGLDPQNFPQLPAGPLH